MIRRLKPPNHQGGMLLIPISQNNATVFLSPPLVRGGLGGVKDYYMILEKWYNFKFRGIVLPNFKQYPFTLSIYYLTVNIWMPIAASQDIIGMIV